MTFKPASFSVVALALMRPDTFIVMAMLIVRATPFALRNMATDIFPEIDIPVVSIIWNYNGLSAQEMGQRIAGQTERGLTTMVSDIEHIESTSLSGVTVLKIFLQPNANSHATTLARHQAWTSLSSGRCSTRRLRKWTCSSAPGPSSRTRLLP